MKKKKIVIIIILIVVFIMIFLIGLYIFFNYRDSQIVLKEEKVVIEYGEKYNPTVEDLIDTEKYNFIKLDKVSIKNEIPNETDKDYPEVGEYDIYVYYNKIELLQKVEVKDTTSPEININEVVEIPYETDLANYDLSSYIKVSDLSETNEYELDYSNVDTSVSGEYTISIKVQDIYGNYSQKDFNVVVQDKPEETPEMSTTSGSSAVSQSSENNTNAVTPSNNSQTTTSTSQATSNNQDANTNTNSSNTSDSQSDLSYWCIEGGTHHIAGDGENEHGYYATWDEAFQAFEEYTKDWPSCQFKVDSCACGLYYFWAIQ